jgi:hypothetical protein
LRTLQQCHTEIVRQIVFDLHEAAQTAHHRNPEVAVSKLTIKRVELIGRCFDLAR